MKETMAFWQTQWFYHEKLHRMTQEDNDYALSLIRARMDTLESRRAVLTERFSRRSVLHEASCLHYLLPDKRDSSVTDRLRHAKTFHSIQARTNKFRNSFFSAILFTTFWLVLRLLLDFWTIDFRNILYLYFSLHSAYCILFNPAFGCNIK